MIARGSWWGEGRRRLCRLRGKNDPVVFVRHRKDFAIEVFVAMLSGALESMILLHYSRGAHWWFHPEMAHRIIINTAPSRKRPFDAIGLNQRA
jgi:hypothetical protein